MSPQISLETYQQRFCPDNTKINTRWAVEEWATCYNQRHPTNACPSGVLLSDDTEELSTWLQTCVLGTRKTNGEKYPARALSTTPAAATDPQQQPCCFSGAHLQNCTINTVITITEHKLQSLLLVFLVIKICHSIDKRTC